MSGGGGCSRAHLPNIGVRETMLDLEQATPVAVDLEARGVLDRDGEGVSPGQAGSPYTLSAFGLEGLHPADKYPVLHRGLPNRFLDTGPGALTLIATDGPAVLRGRRFRPVASVSPSCRRAPTPRIGGLEPIDGRSRRPTGSGLFRHCDAFTSGVRVGRGDRRRATVSRRLRTVSAARTNGTPLFRGSGNDMNPLSSRCAS